MPPADHQKAVTYTTYLKVEELLSLAGATFRWT
jgi:hypothetical protein